MKKIQQKLKLGPKVGRKKTVRGKNSKKKKQPNKLWSICQVHLRSGYTDNFGIITLFLKIRKSWHILWYKCPSAWGFDGNLFADVTMSLKLAAQGHRTEFLRKRKGAIFWEETWWEEKLSFVHLDPSPKCFSLRQPSFWTWPPYLNQIFFSLLPHHAWFKTSDSHLLESPKTKSAHFMYVSESICIWQQTVLKVCASISSAADYLEECIAGRKEQETLWEQFLRRLLVEMEQSG